MDGRGDGSDAAGGRSHKKCNRQFASSVHDMPRVAHVHPRLVRTTSEPYKVLQSGVSSVGNQRRASRCVKRVHVEAGARVRVSGCVECRQGERLACVCKQVGVDVPQRHSRLDHDTHCRRENKNHP